MTTVVMERVRSPGFETTHARVTSPPIWLGRKFVVNMPMKLARTASAELVAMPAAIRNRRQRSAPRTSEPTRARTAATIHGQLLPERRLTARPKSIRTATTARRTALSRARTHTDPARERTRFRADDDGGTARPASTPPSARG
jgi:hypothetical protein